MSTKTLKVAKAKKEERIVLSVNNLAIETQTREAENIADGINWAVKMVSEFLKRELTPDEVEALFENHNKFIDAEIMKDAQFPKAEVSFNLMAQGIDPTIYTSLCGICKKNFIKLDSVKLQDGQAVVLYDVIIERHTSYIQTELQREAYEIAEKLLPLVTRLKELNIAGEAYINDALKVIGADGYDNYEIRKEYIHGLKMRR
ncbi:MAG: hypothetical protein WDA08_04595 [Weeksellaceae bacterium]|nr:hypothetical protein [Acholeplasmataceae bacterium]